MSPRSSRILEGTAIGAFFAPRPDGSAAFTREVGTRGRFVPYGRRSFIVVIEPKGAHYVRRVKDAGVLLLVDPRVIAACFRWASSEQGRG